MNASTKAAIAAIFASVAGAASAQSSVTLYGDIDQYVNYMHAGNGQKIISLEDGGLLRSRWGMKGSEDLGSGYAAKFQVEGGFSADNGQNSGVTSGTGANTSSMFDRQTWVGLGTPWGEFRAGRQNTPIQARGGYVDYTARDLGSLVNEFAVPSRYDNDVSFISKRYFGLQVEVHAALPEAANNLFVPTAAAPANSQSGNTNRAMVYNWALDYLTKDFALGYMGTLARPSAKLLAANTPAAAAGSTYYDKNVSYHQAYADWYYGAGTVYLTFIHSNDQIPSITGTPLAGTPSLANSGGNGVAANQFNYGITPEKFFNVYQASADYLLLPNLRIGGLWGKIDDTSHTHRGATGASVGAYWDLSKRTTVYSTLQQTRNQSGAAFKESGSAGLKSQFSNADVQGKTINGAGVGVVVRF